MPLADPWFFRGRLVYVHDGDTLHALVDLGFATFSEQSFRLEGIFAPELGKPGGREATTALTEWLTEHRHGLPVDAWPLLLQTHKDTQVRSFNRYVAKLSCFQGHEYIYAGIPGGRGT